MQTLTVSSKGQIVLPAAIRRRFGLCTGSQLSIQETENGLQLTVIHPATPCTVAQSAGMITVPTSGKARSLNDFDAAAFVDD